MANEPVLLGQTTVNWLYQLCNAMLAHTHWYKHLHTNAGQESPSTTQAPVELQPIIALRDSLHTLLSRRVFVTGGGLPPVKMEVISPMDPHPSKLALAMEREFREDGKVVIIVQYNHIYIHEKVRIYTNNTYY